MQKVATFAISILIAIGLFSALASRSEPESSTTDLAASDSLNYESYSEGINTVRFDANGNINYTLRAQSQIQYSAQLTEIEKPLIRLFQDGNPTWNVVADTGTVNHFESELTEAQVTNRTIELSGNVEAYSVDDYGNRTVVSTEILLVDPNTEILSTESPVKLKSEFIEQSGIGMLADLKTDEVILHREVRGIYEQQSN